jgi:hypothetical protein
VFTTLLDLLAVAALSTFAWFVWEPLPLLVVGLSCLVVSRRRSR